MADRFVWTVDEWARIERVALEHREARENLRAHATSGVSGLRLKTAQAIARDTALELRGWAHVAGSPFANELIRDRRRMLSAHDAARRSTAPGVAPAAPAEPRAVMQQALDALKLAENYSDHPVYEKTMSDAIAGLTAALGVREDALRRAGAAGLDPDPDVVGVTEGPAPRWWHCKHCQLEAPTENVNLGPTHKTCGYEVTPATLGVTVADGDTKR